MTRKMLNSMIITALLTTNIACNNLEQKIENTSQKDQEKKEIIVKNEQKTYDQILNEIKQTQQTFQTQYKNANETEKKEIIKSAQTYINDSIIKEIFPAWYGTNWEFEGISKKPGKNSSIACGHFIGRTLNDAGFNISPEHLGQQVSSYIIKNLNENKKTKAFSNKPISDIEEFIEKNGKGLYVVGLDKHAATITYDENGMKLVHSSYYLKDDKVLSEPLEGHNPFADSQYRVVGKIIDENMVKNWLTDKRMKIKYCYLKEHPKEFPNHKCSDYD
ncbi:hypothetical protein K9L67_02460 [Candidatus Woesearchaeota archaeon]|nr:hypothetical protein [Candidatus Woesearchaeota archaeon]MCF7901068.1 hypothetical protein [Candidatus Woesearchaeota archaeon]MCF8013619.1 hypothetical protein [Candidatus Woesearchaeota archaeon]